MNAWSEVILQGAKVLLLAVITGGTCRLLCGIGKVYPGRGDAAGRSARSAAAAVFVLQAADIAWRRRECALPVQCLFGVVAGCFLAACVMDLGEQAVYRYVWAAGGVAAGLLLAVRIVREQSAGGYGAGRSLMVLGIYILIQHGLFGRMYGRADCHAFSVGAVVFTAMGGGFQDYVAHMAVAFLGLTLVQGIRKNISADGNLKTPVPFLPYITVSFWVWVDFASGKWYI